MPWSTQLQLLGGRFHFESNSRELLQTVRLAYAGLPPMRFRSKAMRFNLRLRLAAAGGRPRGEPPLVKTLSGPQGILCGVMDGSNYVFLSPRQRCGLIVVSRDMLQANYHVRYELIEFAVFTLACRAQGLMSLHAACVGLGGRGALLIGPSGAGKSTLVLECSLQGMQVLSEDAVFVRPSDLRATGVPNFLHVRRDSLRLLASDAAARIRRSPVIRRRSGVEKFQVDLRRFGTHLAAGPLSLEKVVFLSSARSGSGATVRPLPHRELIARLRESQAYTTQLPGWPTFRRNLRRAEGFELLRGAHPAESAVALRHILDPRLTEPI